MTKDCGTCRHETLEHYLEPCCLCMKDPSGYPGWEKRDEYPPEPFTEYVHSDYETAPKDPINPAHYKNTYAVEVIKLIKSALTEDEYRGYLKGNMLKYRLRAGYKDDRNQDLDKSNWYQDALKEVSNES